MLKVKSLPAILPRPTSHVLSSQSLRKHKGDRLLDKYKESKLDDWVLSSVKLSYGGEDGVIIFNI